MTFKTGKIGLYGNKTRDLQKRISYERFALTMKLFKIYRYLGDPNNATPSIDDIADLIFMENRERLYDKAPITINGWREGYMEDKVDLTRYGLINPMGDEIRFMFHITSFDADQLGRYMMVGDVIEVPFEEKDGRLSLYQVNDVDRSIEEETFTVVVKATPLTHTESTHGLMDITGAPTSDAFDVAMDSLDAELGALEVSGIDVTEYQVSNTPKLTQKLHGDFLDDPNAEIF